MNKVERKYQFRERLSQVHPANIRDHSLTKNTDEYELHEGLVISLPPDAGEVALTGAKDFCDFLYTSMHISARYTQWGRGDITVVVDPSYKDYKAFRAEVKADGVTLTAHDERGAAQALYFLEEEMSARHAPFVRLGVTERAPLFTPRLTHSGFMLDEFPDHHLARIAHSGMDAIMVMAYEVNVSLWGNTDFNDLIRRAAAWGLDVYIYSYIESNCHPDDPGAKAFFENSYGKLFRECPGLKGVILVGESTGFPSKDPRVSPLHYYDNNVDGIPAAKPSADFFPCCDYPKWLNMLKETLAPCKPDADIIFWSYNWGYADKQARQDLIRNLPKDVSLLVTFETFEPYKISDGVYELVYDYSLAFEGPGVYFKSEAEVAKECGVRLYAMTNTGGNSWDMGGLPYEPMPGQWRNRAEQVILAKEKYGLAGVMENHQYGFYPSIITEMIKYMYETGEVDVDRELTRIIQRHFGFGHEETIKEALEKWSEGIRHMPSSGEEQNGAFRVGPVFAFSIAGRYMAKAEKSAKGHFQVPKYTPYNRGDRVPVATTGVRLPVEKQMLETMRSLFREGCELLESIPVKNDELLYLINTGRYMECMAVTGINAKRWFLVTQKLVIEPDNDKVLALIKEADAILNDERENVLRAMPLVQADSRLGWDPRMEYVADPARLEWKLKLLDYVQNTELNQYRTCAEFTAENR